MASLTIRNLDDGLKSLLRVQAAKHGKSMEEEARDVLRQALAQQDTVPGSLLLSIREKIAKAGFVDLEIPPRDAPRPLPDFSE